MKVFTVPNNQTIQDYLVESSDYYTTSSQFTKPYVVITVDKKSLYTLSMRYEDRHTLKASNKPQGVLLSTEEFFALELIPTSEAKQEYLAECLRLHRLNK